MLRVLHLFIFLTSVQVYATLPVRPIPTTLTERGYFCEGNRSNIMTTLFGTFSREDINSVQSIKSEKDIDEWIRCYTTDKGYATFNSSKKLLKAAEKEFGVPYALMACKIWQETHWQEGQVSFDNARGVVQVLPQQVATLKNIMALVSNPPAEVKEYVELNKKYNQAYDEIKKLEERAGQQDMLEDWTKKQSELEDKIRAAREKDIIKNYDIGVVLNSAWLDWAKKNNLNSDICNSSQCNSSRDLANYNNKKWAIGAGSLNALYLMVKLDDDFSRKSGNEGESMSYSREEFHLIMATAYNSGQSGPVQELKPINEASLNKSRRAKVERIKGLLLSMKQRSAPGIRGWGQTACYVSNIDACLRPNNMKPVTSERPSQEGERCGVSDAKSGEPSKNLIECK